MAKPRECRYCKELKVIKAHGFCGACYQRILTHGTPEKRSRKKATVCSFCGANGKIVKGLCIKCYERKKRNGTPEYVKVKKECQIEGCSNLRVSHGLCDKHRQRVRRNATYLQTRPKDWGKREKHPLIHIYRWIMKFQGRVYVYKPWVDDFWEFVKDVGERPSGRHQLRRIVVDEGYSPENCQWVEIDDSKTHTEYQRKWRAKNPDKVKNQHLKRKFGITLDQYNEMHKSQNGVCKICKNPEPYKGYSLAVDHCHECGEIRGLLCSRCNRAIGWLEDSPERLIQAAIYLEETGCNSDKHKKAS